MNGAGAGGRQPAVTLLYTPADRPDRVAKALRLDADVVVVDLEDAVAPTAKTAAREALPSLLRKRAGKRVQVRVNALNTAWGRADLETVAGLDSEIEVRLPKVESTACIDQVVAILGPDRALHCLLETPLGVENAFEIASHSSAVASIALGEADLRSSLAVVDDRGLDWARGRVLIAATAAGLPAPAQGIYPAVRDLQGLATSSREGRRMGLSGRAAVHPAQLPVIRDAYRPPPEEVRRAHAVLRALDHAAVTGTGVAVLDDGSFVDAAMAAGARRVIELDQLTAPRTAKVSPRGT